MPTYNRDHRILIKIEHKPGSVPLTEKSLEEPTEIISTQLKKSKATDKDVRTVQMLQSGNVSSQMVGGGEVQKLQANLDWAQALGDASIVTRSFGVVSHGVFLHKTDMEDKEATIRYLTRKVKNALPNLTITAPRNGWLRGLTGEKTIGSLILEVTDPVTANRMIDEGIVTGSQMHACILYKPKCGMKQCFKFSQYGHQAARCQNRTDCAVCSESHKSTVCPNSSPKRCCKRWKQGDNHVMCYLSLYFVMRCNPALVMHTLI